MKDTSWLLGTPIAHRGLHNNIDIPENSMKAFRNAVEHGYGIEFDVYLSLDGKVIIHHDWSLKRMCGMRKKAPKINTDKLQDYKLINTDESIPLLTDMLDMVAGQVPLVLEIKTTTRVVSTCQAVYDIVKDYKGNICIESFDERIVKWWHHNHPEFVLGQLYSVNPNRKLQKAHKLYKLVDFLAVSTKNLPEKYFADIKKECPEKLIINWTVRTTEHLENARKYADNIIFECNIKNPEYISLDQLTQ